MSKRGSPAVPVIIVIAVVGAFLYGFYCYHDQHTRLKLSEDSADKLKQKTESLNAQLQVLYEHKTRLETAVSQEKEISKKTREDSESRQKELESKVDQQKNENADLKQQVEGLQKKLEASEAAATKAMEEQKQLQQENENAVAKLKDELANVKRRLEDCYEKPNVHADENQQDADEHAERQVNQVPSDEDENKGLQPDDDENMRQQQENMQVAAPIVSNNQSLAAQDNFESIHRNRRVPVDVADPSQQESKKSVRGDEEEGAKEQEYDNDIEKPHNL